MARDVRHRRILIYSHDSFGLGHLRRCRTIAHALVERRSDVSVLILSGSPIIGSFSFRSRVDFVRVPGVIKLRHGDYSPLKLDIGIDGPSSCAPRSSATRRRPSPPTSSSSTRSRWGLRGEVRDTLAMLKSRGTPLVLGLRDVMDDPASLAEEWHAQERHAGPRRALRSRLDLRHAGDVRSAGRHAAARDRARQDPLHRLSAALRAGDRPSHRAARPVHPGPYILVTAGGGGDGAVVIDWVLRAYEHDPTIPYRALIVLGPFMHSTTQGGFQERAARLDNVEAITFDADIETLMTGAAGIVAMGGYNTFCEILSFDKPGLIVPRTVPRQEQFIRASRGEALGLVRMLAVDGVCEPATMAAALRALPHQPRPSEDPHRRPARRPLGDRRRRRRLAHRPRRRARPPRRRSRQRLKRWSVRSRSS
jgi:predicted glycosyltransferase